MNNETKPVCVFVCGGCSCTCRLRALPAARWARRASQRRADLRVQQHAHPPIRRSSIPEVRKSTSVDDYFGTKVADPYRWLEDETSAETKAWIDEQNKVTFAYLDKIPYREKLKARLTRTLQLSAYLRAVSSW